MIHGSPGAPGPSDPPEAAAFQEDGGERQARSLGNQPPTRAPWATYMLLGLIAVMFVAQIVAGGPTNTGALTLLGAQINTRVASGELWRLLAAMFLHIGPAHLAFNAWALFSVGRDVEWMYGRWRFLALYFIAGIAGNLAYYLLGENVLSAGASGAVFGVFGAELAYFLLNRHIFGDFGKQRLTNLAVLIGINVVLGFTVPGINFLAHLGGLVMGVALGLAISPHYRILPSPWGEDGPVRVLDRRRNLLRWVALTLAVALLFLGLRIGHARWMDSADMLAFRAEERYNSGDLPGAQHLLEQAVARRPDDGTNLYNLGVIYLQTDQPAKAVWVLEQARANAPDAGINADLQFSLGVAYVANGEYFKAEPLLRAFVNAEPEGERAAYARSVLAAGAGQ